MGVSGVGNSNSGGSSNLGFGGGDNEDLKAERRAIQRESLKEGNESFKLSEKKKILKQFDNPLRPLPPGRGRSLTVWLRDFICVQKRYRRFHQLMKSA